METLVWPLAGAGLLLILFAAQTILASKRLAKGEPRKSRPLISLMFFAVCGLIVWIVVSGDPGAAIRGEHERTDGKNTGLFETPRAAPGPWASEGVGEGEAQEAADPAARDRGPEDEEAPLRGREAPAAEDEVDQSKPPDMSREGEEPPPPDETAPPFRRPEPVAPEAGPTPEDPVAEARRIADEATALLARERAGYAAPDYDLGGEARAVCGFSGGVKGVFLCAAEASLYADAATLGVLQREGGRAALALAVTYALAEGKGREAASCLSGALVARLDAASDARAAFAALGRAARAGGRLAAAALDRERWNAGRTGGFAACP
jgi:hypothetical protein